MSLPMPRPFKSAALAWSAGTPGNDLPLLFLKSAVTRSARISDMRLRVSLTVTTAVSGGANSVVMARAIKRLIIKDRFGVRVDLPGSSLRVIDFLEYPGALINRNLGASAATTIVFYLRIPMMPAWHIAPSQLRWMLADLVEGGSVSIDFAATPIGEVVGNQLTTVTAGSVELHVGIVDERKDTKKTRCVLRDWPITASSLTFPITGRLAYLLQYIGEVGESTVTPGAWASQNLSSRTLDQASVRSDYLADQYLDFVRPRRAAPSLAAEDSEDPVVVSSVIPLVVPRARVQGITEMPSVQTVDWSTDAAFGAGTFLATNLPRMIACYIEDRPGEESGDIHLADGRMAKRSMVAPDLRRKLPSSAG